MDINIEASPPEQTAINRAEVMQLLGLLPFIIIPMVGIALWIGGPAEYEPVYICMFFMPIALLLKISVTLSEQAAFQTVSAELYPELRSWMVRSPVVQAYVNQVKAQGRELVRCEYFSCKNQVEKEAREQTKQSFYGA